TIPRAANQPPPRGCTTTTHRAKRTKRAKITIIPTVVTPSMRSSPMARIVMQIGPLSEWDQVVYLATLSIIPRRVRLHRFATQMACRICDHERAHLVTHPLRPGPVRARLLLGQFQLLLLQWLPTTESQRPWPPPRGGSRKSIARGVGPHPQVC